MCIYQMLQHQLQGQRITLNIGWQSHTLIHFQRFPSCHFTVFNVYSKEASLLYQPCKLVWLTNPTFKRIFQNCLLNYVGFSLSIVKFCWQLFMGSKSEKSSATNWRNIVARYKFLVASLYNVNDTTHSMARSICFNCLKILRTEVGINLEVNWLCVCDLAHFL